MAMRRSWKTLAASAPLAPAANASAKCVGRARPARGDDGHVDRGDERAQLVEVIAAAHAVAVHAVEHDLARAERDGLDRPGDGLAPGVLGRFGAAGELLDAPVAARAAQAVDAQHDALAAEGGGELGDQVGAGERGAS